MEVSSIDIFILQVKLDKKNTKLYHIVMSNEQEIAIHEDILIKYGLTKGTCLESSIIADISRENQNYLAYIKAIKYLGLKSRTGYQIATYLKGHEFTSDDISYAIKRLEQDGYINDEQFAMNFVKFSAKAKGKGKNWVKQYLTQLGIARQSIEVALESYDDEQDLELAITLAEKKWSQLKGEEREKRQKCGQFLLRRGFSSDIARKALKSVENTRFLDENLDIYS